MMKVRQGVIPSNKRNWHRKIEKDIPRYERLLVQNLSDHGLMRDCLCEGKQNRSAMEERRYERTITGG
ncbi:MAG: hypothetical protein GTO12_16175 [Proteobacteria bacterium]|nr:hypothetical protein [Pseudomonadota bacterium]